MHLGRRRAPLPAAFLAAAMVAAVFSPALAWGQGAAKSRAIELIRNRQYNDAIRILQQETQGKPDAECGPQFFLLGECYYMTGQYATARPMYTKAVQNVSDGANKAVAEYRIACVLFKLKEFAAAAQKIDDFAAKYPADERLGRLLAYKMLIVSGKGKAAQEELEKLHARIYSDIRKYDHATGMEADQILCDFYRRNGQEDKAQAVYIRLVQNFKKVIVDLKSGGQSIPKAFEQSHDNAALQLGVLFAERKSYGEAVKWLENVQYDLEAKAKSRLLLAKIAYERNDFAAAAAYLSAPGFLDGVPAGALKSDMYLLLGLAEKANPNGSASRVEEYLKKVGPEARGYQQAQSGLGDIYRDKGLGDEAIKCYTNVLSNSDYAPNALLSLGTIYMQQADRVGDAAKALALNKRAGEALGTLLKNYALTPQAKAAREKAEILSQKGISGALAGSEEELLKGWERTASQKRGTTEAAQALVSIMRYHFRTVTDEKTRKVLRNPHYAACAAACDQLLDEKTYGNGEFAAAEWKHLRGEVAYHRGVCELASAFPPKDRPDLAATFIKGATAERAAEFFRTARPLVNPKQLELVKGIELGLLEAMFKSPKAETKEEAEKRFRELENDYGTDSRFQKLAMDLAGWYSDQGRHAEAGKAYVGIADRAKDLPEEDQLRLLYSGGSLLTRAGFEALRKKDQIGVALYIYPKETVDLGDEVLKGHPPLQKVIQMTWPRPGNKNPTAGEALRALSSAARVAFVWPQAKGLGRIATYLDETRPELKDGRYSVAQALAMVLDLKTHRVAFDIGLADGQPTLPPPTVKEDDPEADRSWKVIEIYDLRQANDRLAAVNRSYGAWRQAHGGRRSGGALLYNVVARVEQVSGIRVLWADGIEKQEKLAYEYRQAPASLGDDREYPCIQVLTAALEPLNLKVRIIRRELAAEYYEQAKDAFNKVRKIDPKSKYGEKALFAVALNYYNLGEYDKMKVILREYLKVFDSPAHEYYHEACFWVGWAFENERKYKEAVNYYMRAAEERLVVCKVDKPLGREDLRKRLSGDSLYSLSEPVASAEGFKGISLQQLADFIQLNTHVSVRVDSSALAADVPITRPPFKKVGALDLLLDAIEPLGLSLRVENVTGTVAERAYYRLALVYRRDNVMDQALEQCNLLLERFPQTTRRRDVAKLMLEIYRGLGDYRKVLATLEDLRKTASDEQEKRELDLEIGGIYYDMAAYGRAADAYKASLGMARDARERLSVRDGYARALFRAGRLADSLEQYELLVKEEADGSTAAFVDSLMVFYLKFALDKAYEREFPEWAMKFIRQYESLTDAQRSALAPADLAKASWVYYALALIDVKKDRVSDAMTKLSACQGSPDDILAGEAGFQLGTLQLKSGQSDKARETFEYLLFARRTPESVVRATYALGKVLEALGRPEKARERYQQLIDRYPASPLIELIQKSPAWTSGPSTTGSTP